MGRSIFRARARNEYEYDGDCDCCGGRYRRRLSPALGAPFVPAPFSGIVRI